MFRPPRALPSPTAGRKGGGDGVSGGGKVAVWRRRRRVVSRVTFRWSGLDAASAPLITLKTGTGMHGSETFPSCAMYSWSSRSLCLAAARQHAMETASTTFAGGVGSSCISASIDGWFSSLPTSLSEISFSTESTDLSSPFPPNRCVSLSYGPIVVMAENVPWIVSTVTSRAGVPEAFRASRAVTPRIELTCALSTCSDVLICTKGSSGCSLTTSFTIWFRCISSACVVMYCSISSLSVSTAAPDRESMVSEAWSAAGAGPRR
mmetsp:Transcript_106323/g.308063  ORF Transcript_106323/g.308063 Transcript_106323/m.308063 type:complete len:263 (-) Transcript_106323:21-809(-)